MKIFRKIILNVLLFHLTLCTITSGIDYIRVGSFNIANLGASEEGEYKRSLVSLVNIIMEMNADVIALQEIEPTELGEKQVERLTKMLNKAAKFTNQSEYEYLIAEEHTGDETAAYLWREPAVFGIRNPFNGTRS